jgi:hypothetical protein
METKRPTGQNEHTSEKIDHKTKTRNSHEVTILQEAPINSRTIRIQPPQVRASTK